ncbi:hypothetical protein BA022_08760 [Diaphorobacter nitroreducens]|uniref:hypothetical protein n=1 Tax=Diaphorobacter nitroreducens TaxID=164759 RepID=UPI000B5995ED|nr:hypothetical protein [Diaphorobacter nitroreducens]ASI68631.1 hypothetical protein BA022_08760 [Diaphorobacter nitroreducens]
MTIDLKMANHTNRELELMLEGRKPLAVFCDEVSVLPNEHIIPEARFAPHVASGMMVREQITLEGPYHPGLGRHTQEVYVLFALAHEAWRIRAFVLIKRVRARTGEYNETLERIESELLGYTQAEIDAWCANCFSGCAPRLRGRGPVAGAPSSQEPRDSPLP